MTQALLSHYNYWFYVLMIALGLYGMIAKGNLMKKLFAMTVFQWAIIFFFLSVGAKGGGDIPILPEHYHGPVDPSAYVNPLPHVLMLTAIVVGVATTGIALALLVKTYRNWGSLEEGEVLRRMRGDA